MFENWGRFVHRRRRTTLWIATAMLVFAAVWGTGVFGALKSSGGFEAPGSESTRAAEISDRDLGRDTADVVLLYRSPGRTVDDPAFRPAVERALAALPRDKVAATATYWSTGSAQFVSKDRAATYAVVRLAGADDQARHDAYEALRDSAAKAPGLTVQIGGGVPIETAINERVSADIAKAESISMPVLLVLLVVIFGSIAAASLPLAIGIVAILGSFTALHLLTLVTDVSIFAVNITTFLGLGLAIDYGLFMVSRFREELKTSGGAATEDALARTMATAGRTVAVSGVTVAVSLSGLLLFDQVFLRSMGFGGVATVVVAMLAALTVLPALLAVLGTRVNALSVTRLLRRRRSATGRPRREDGHRWYRLAHAVMRRPIVFTVATIALLLALGSPFLHINWGAVDSRVLPTGTEARVVTEVLERDFPRNATTPIEAIVTGTGDRAALAAYADRLRQVPGATGAGLSGAEGTTSRVAIGYDADPTSEQARSLVQRVRDVPPPPGAEVHVGGASAEIVDQLDSLGDVLPVLALFVGVATFILLFLAFGSVILPLKAIVMNVLSLSATFGALVWIFQDGNLSGLLDFTATGSIAPAMPILMLVMIFGISMDYEVFLLSRIREQYDLGGDNTEAVATGMRRTGGIITSAALLFIVVIGAFSTSGITFIKMTGIGMAIAIAVDATVVRGLLVPATMRLLGRANWWAPGPLGRLYRRYGISEHDVAPEPTPEPATAGI
ncbi:MMPL family transporter [Actinomadura sp. HBU206391]|uniref:MMPL family transporter n=1 Tax=Actinomadura sp. HBU206391 TaxID=2731692 RepID=UPI00164FF603|nr:MMPL family transporter [Actinomadura sp. HBU206391]MBC6459771.1 MMPL family transporter [Actinomadura sp. HBU206391]